MIRNNRCRFWGAYKELVEKGRSQGYISNLDLGKFLPPDIVEQGHIEDVIRMLNDMGIEVRKEKAEVINLRENNNDE